MSTLFEAMDQVLDSFSKESRLAGPEYTALSSASGGTSILPTGQTKPPLAPDPLDPPTSRSMPQLSPTAHSPSDDGYHSRRHDSCFPTSTSSASVTSSDSSTPPLRNNSRGGGSSRPVQEYGEMSIPSETSGVHHRLVEGLAYTGLTPTALEEVSLNRATLYHSLFASQRYGSPGVAPTTTTSGEIAPAGNVSDSTTLGDLLTISGHLPLPDDYDDLMVFISHLSEH